MGLAVRAIFDKIRPSSSCRVTFSCFEIYDEKIHDLLNDRALVRMQSSMEKKSKSRVLHFNGLKKEAVEDENAVKRLLSKSIDGKTMGSNYLHDHSSRSHTVMQLCTEGEEDGMAWQSSLTVVDLAGAEAAHRNDSTQGRQEGAAINTSLMHLKQCIGALARRKGTEELSPSLFRQCALTRLIEPCVNGGHHVGVMCNLPPLSADMRVTVDTLAFGELAQVHAQHLT